MQSDVVWSRRLADELWSGVVTPLTFTLLADVMAEHMARRRLARAGLDAPSRLPVFRLEYGHVYVNASLVAEVMQELPALVVSEGLLRLLPDRLRAEVRRNARSTLSPHVLSTVVHLALRERGWMPWSRAAVFREEAARVARELEKPVDASALPPADLAARIAALQARLGGYLDVVSWAMIYAYVFFHLTAEMVARWGDGEADISQLVAGADGIRTFEIHAELRACARLAERDPALRHALLAGDPERVAEACLAGDLGELGARVRALLQRHGHRLLARDLSSPTWRERPAAVVESLRRLVIAGDGAAERSTETGPAVDRVLRRIGSGLAGTARREAFRLSLGWCREYYAVRENMRYHADLFLAALRGLVLAAGRRLSAAGTLASHEDVFYLTAGELLTALDPGSAAPSARALREAAATRRAEYDGFRRTPPPDVLVGDRPEPETASEGDRLRSLRGVGVSPGRAAGDARVIRRVEDLESLRRGEVIVAASTDPSWTSFLSLGGALVLEAGGMLSHGAIVARELGIPAVADVSRATAILQTGDRLTVDGGSGQVAVAAG
ncbi:MAG TPA: PEP-utilizing enzyme [Candidatus Binatia bacterium]|nr:PEP-utilizing enzyme [Candidatus Binatia bacterium]